MIAEIGMVVAMYVLARLLSGSRPMVAKSVSVLAVLTALLVLADLTFRTFNADGILGVMFTDEISSSSSASVQRPSNTSVTRADGGSITTPLGYGIVVAKGSTLKREWIAVHDSTLPAQLEGTPGVVTVYVSRQYGGDYRYRTKFAVTTREAVRAFEVRFLTFDVWGEHVRTLRFEEVADIAANTRKEVSGEWSLYSENDVEKHYASIGYIVRVRLAGGRVIDAPTDRVIEEAKKFSEKFTAAELEPKSPVAPTSEGGKGGA